MTAQVPVLGWIRPRWLVLRNQLALLHPRRLAGQILSRFLDHIQSTFRDPALNVGFGAPTLRVAPTGLSRE
jgi:hypothetical protein